MGRLRGQRLLVWHGMEPGRLSIFLMEDLSSAVHWLPWEPVVGREYVILCLSACLDMHRGWVCVCVCAHAQPKLWNLENRSEVWV